jgi:hypothetical protein
MEGAWPRGKLIAFRFGLIATTLVMSLHLWIFVPSRTVILGLVAAWHMIATWLGALLGLDVPPHHFTGSGDQLFYYLQFLASLIIAALATAVWTLLSRARAYPRLADASISALRVMLCAIMIGYGMAKVVPMQFPPLWLGRYDQSLGEMSPMGLLWTFMGHSPAYTFFAGAAEVVGSVLLLSRRSYVIGALILIGVMTNVVLLNLCYDVPVKLFSMQLLVLLFVVIAPQARRLLAAVLGYPAREMPPRVRGTLTGERVRLAIKLVAIGMIVFHISGHLEIGDRIRKQRTPTALHGSWVAERVVIDGVEHPPLFTDDARWRKLIFHELGLTIRYATDRREYARVHVDPKAQTIEMTKGILRQVWRYQRPDDNHLIVDAPRVHAELVLEPEPLLKTRGFHWVQEEPFGR